MKETSSQKVSSFTKTLKTCKLENGFLRKQFFNDDILRRYTWDKTKNETCTASDYYHMTCSWVLNFEDTTDAGTWIVYTSQEPLNLALSSSYELFNHVRVTVYEEPTVQLTGKNE